TDSNQTHNKFIAKYNLKLKLLSDVDNTLCEYFDIWVEKNMYGKKFMGIERSTFLINTSGIIIKEWRKVKVNGHAETLLETIREL
ncbi:redoxin domain-containing protein, partial [Amylibacter sp.]|nr:redoxin domain-containing protein [Amylibacter sp.]